MFDNAYSSLIEDLKDRGLLDTTMVLGDGRVRPYPKAQSCRWRGPLDGLLDGGVRRRRVKGGQVVGASDEIGGAPKDRPVTPPEVAATFSMP